MILGILLFRFLFRQVEVTGGKSCGVDGRGLREWIFFFEKKIIILNNLDAGEIKDESNEIGVIFGWLF